MRLIGPNGEQVGVIATSVALNLAKEANLDLVEVAPNAKPPVAKLIDYGKFKYNEKIKAREARRNQNTAEIKEIRFRLKIDDHDFEVKKGHVVRFLNADTRAEVATVDEGTVGVNDPSRLIFNAPALDEGAYILQVETYFSNATTLLKQPRLIDYPVTLYVGERPSTGGDEEEEERPGGL